MSRRQEFFAGLMVFGALALTGCAGATTATHLRRRLPWWP